VGYELQVERRRRQRRWDVSHMRDEEDGKLEVPYVKDDLMGGYGGQKDMR